MEVEALFRNLLWLKKEICCLWCDTTRKLSVNAIEEGSCLGQELEDPLFSWRTVGIPKKDDSSRPIGVASYLVRAWLSACAESLPQPHWSQWAGRKQTTVIQAIAHWYQASESEGLEGPRFFQVAGELASEPIRGIRGLPQGDSMAPGGMVSVLVPWQPAQGGSWALMDDRSTAAKAKSPDEAEKVKYPEEFDRASGLVENMSKRQKWTIAGKERVEQLGVNAAPADTSQPVVLRGTS